MAPNVNQEADDAAGIASHCIALTPWEPLRLARNQRNAWAEKSQARDKIYKIYRHGHNICIHTHMYSQSMY